MKNDRRAVYLAWSLWSVCVALTGASIFFLVLNVSNDAHIFDWWLGNTTVVIDVTVGAIVASRRPGNPVGWLLCLFGVAVGASSFTSQYAIYALLARGGSVPAGEAAAWVSSWTLPVIIGLQASYVLLFPTGRLPGRRWRLLAAMIGAFILGGAVLAAFTPDAYLGSLDPIRNPLGVAGFTVFYEALIYVAAPILFGLAALSVFVRLRRASGVERQQIKWFAYAAAILAVGTLLNVLTLVLEPTPSIAWIVAVIFILSGNVVPVAIGIAILRHRLYDIDRLINRTLVYGALTASLALVYFACVGASQFLFRSITGEDSQIVIVASTLAIAALFGPLRRRIQNFIDRRFYRGKYDARKVMDGFALRMRDEVDISDLNEDLVSVVRQTVQPAHASLWLKTAWNSKDSQKMSETSSP